MFLTMWRAFLAPLNDQEKLRWDEYFADGSFAWAKKGIQRGQDQKGQGHEVNGFTPLGAYLDLAFPAEVTLVEKTRDTVEA